MNRPHTSARIAAIAAVSTLSVTVAVSPASAQERLAEPPAADALVEATNAMVRPADLAAPLLVGVPSKDRQFNTGYFNPPGGQDPLPVCVSGPSYKTVSIPRDDAVGYLASYGRVNQYEYEYPSAARAQQAWAELSKQVSSKCNGSFTEQGVQTVNKATRVAGVPGGPQGWAVANSGNLNAFSAVHLIGDTIQMVAYNGGQGVVPAKSRTAMAKLATTLAGRWADRGTLAVTQDATLTKAERTMVQPSDVPAALSLASGADGGWSSYQGSVPAYGPEVFCKGEAKLPKGTQTFESVLFSGGDVLGVIGKGWVSQRVEAYASAALAQQAWVRVTEAVAKCTQNATKPISTKKDFERLTNGVSTVAVNGVPGVWVSGLDTYPTIDKGYTNGTYSVYLLAGDSIQEVTYGITQKGVGEVAIDQGAVGSMAGVLADRWVSSTG